MRALTTVLVLVLAGLLPGLAVPTTSWAAVPRTARTTVVLTVEGCEGCTFTPSSSLDDGPRWTKKGTVEVRNGKARFTMPTWRTQGLRLALSAPFADDTGGVPHVVLHFQGQRLGDGVSTYDAQTARKGSVCFRGTARRTLRMAVTVRQVQIPGDGVDGSPAVGALAYASTTQRTLMPFELVRDGYFAAQAVPTCQAPATAPRP